jgi:geranylgeranyl reductase family protein
MRVAIAGAGPAGAAAAIALARAGVDVRLYDKAAWPRAKTCGDGLTPSSVAHYRDLGIDLPLEPAIATTVMVGPDGALSRGRWPGGMPDGTCRARMDSDGRLLDAALAAGARFAPSTAVESWRNGTLTLRDASGTSSERADALLVADGATGALATKLGFPPHHSRLVALRGYADTRAPLSAEYRVHYDAAFLPGYAWLFPVAPRRANVGIAVTEDCANRFGGDLRAALRAWLARDAQASAYVAPDAVIEDVHGGVIPSGRDRRYANRALLIGDAAGVADPLSAEGVSQAIATGLAAAAALLAHDDVDAAGAAYERALAPFDRNELEARKMMRWMRVAAGPICRLAALRPPVADALIATGYFLKPDGSWFYRSMWSLFAPGTPTRSRQAAGTAMERPAP